MKYAINTLDDFDVAGKTVLCRVDINSPLDPASGDLADTTRLRGCAPTVRELAERGAKVVLLAHQGGDLEYHNFASTERHAAVLCELVGRPVTFIDDVCGPAARAAITHLADGEVLLLDNVRFVSEEMTLFETKLKLSAADQAKTLVVRKLAPLADLYVCDAFAAVHRSQPSLVGFEQVLPSAMGRLFEREYTALSHLREDPARPCVFVLGGAKIQEAFPMMSAALRDDVVDTVLACGLVAQVMLLAAGHDLGGPSTAYVRDAHLDAFVEESQSILTRYGDKVMLPSDLAYVAGDGRREVAVADLPVDELLLDLGHDTVNRYQQRLSGAGTVFVNGPAGVFEKSESEYATRSLWEAMATCDGYTALGGGDSIAAMNRYGLGESFDYVCTAGGGMVKFLSGDVLPVVEALKSAAERFA